MFPPLRSVIPFYCAIFDHIFPPFARPGSQAPNDAPAVAGDQGLLKDREYLLPLPPGEEGEGTSAATGWKQPLALPPLWIPRFHHRFSIILWCYFFGPQDARSLPPLFKNALHEIISDATSRPGPPAPDHGRIMDMQTSLFFIWIYRHTDFGLSSNPSVAVLIEGDGRDRFSFVYFRCFFIIFILYYYFILGVYFPFLQIPYVVSSFLSLFILFFSPNIFFQPTKSGGTRRQILFLDIPGLIPLETALGKAMSDSVGEAVGDTQPCVDLD